MNSSSPARPLTGATGMGRTGRLGLVFALVVAAILGAAAIAASSAKADPVTFTLDQGRINLGDLQGLAVIDPTAEPPDAPATLSGEFDEFGQFSAEPAGFSFPDKILRDIPVEPVPGVVLNLNIVAKFSAGGDITGIYDPVAGDLAIDSFPLDAAFDIYVAPATDGTPLAQCGISDIPVPLNTDTDLVDNTDPENPVTYAGAPFAPVGGAATTWESLPPVAGGGLCDLAADMLGGPGGLWLSGTSSAFIPPAPTLVPQLSGGPESPTAATTASFSFVAGSGEGPIVSGFECKLDDGDFEACTSPKSYTGVSVGSHTFEVRSTNVTGDGPAASHGWTVVGLPLAPSITSGPEDGTTDTDASFTFAQNGSETQPVTGFECSMDSTSAWSDCTSPKGYSDLTPGSHNFRVRAKTIAGNGPSSLYHWTIEGIVLPPTAAPDLSGPPAQTASTTAEFTFEAGDDETQDVTGFECKLDGGAFEACSSPKEYTALSVGDHTVQVRSTNSAGEGPAANSTWKVVGLPTAAPDVTSQPPAETDSPDASFTFTAGAGETQPLTGFECKLDEGDFEACASPKTYTALGLGEHTFQVRSVSIAGSGSAASADWTVATTPVEAPDVTGKPDPVTTASAAEFTFAAGAGETQTVTGFECKIDGGAFEPCASPKSYTAFALGEYTFTVRAVNTYGAGPESSYSWEIVAAATAPVAAPDVTGKPAASTTDTAAEFTFAAGAGETQTVTGFECKLDAGAFEACSSPKSYSGLTVGAHTFAVRAVNTIGNGPESSYGWTVASKPVTGKPALGNLAINPKNRAVKRGKKAVITVRVKNVGKAAAKGVKVCVKAPARLVNVKKCQNIGSLAAGKTVARKFSVKVKPKAKGKKAVLTFTATANGVKKKTGKATIRIR